MRFPQPERRRSRTDLAALVVLLVGSGLLSTLQPAQQLRVASTLRRTVLLPFVVVHQGFTDRATLGERYQRLRSERDSLAAELVQARRLARSGRQLRSFVGLAAPGGGELVPVDVVPGRPRIGDSDVFVLEGRELSGVTPPAGVFTGRGLVGVMRAVEPSGALGEFWTHPDFRVSVQTPDGAISGIVRAVRRGDGQPVMVLEGAPFQEDIAPGTPLYTTGLAGIFPAGVPVGTVREVSGVESGWSKSYTVEPAVRPEAADVALLWRRPPGRDPAASTAAGDTGAPPPEDGEEEGASAADTTDATGGPG